MKLSWAIAPIAAVGFCALPTGCSSIKSKIYDYDNYACDGRQVKCLHGIPETLDVPTHIKITVTETRYYKGPALRSDGSNKLATAISKTDESARQATPPEKYTNLVNEYLTKIAELETNRIKLEAEAKANVEEIAKNKAQIAALKKQLDEAKVLLAEQERYSLAPNVHPTRSMTYDVIKKKELYTVDFKRPASGIGDLKITYGTQSGGQFFNTYGQEVTDTSIKDIGNLVSKVAEVLPKLKAISDSNKEADAARAKLGLHAVTTVVAVEYFDVHLPNLEGRIQEFLDRNINACSPPCQDSIRPLPVAQFPNQTSGLTVPLPAAAAPAPLPATPTPAYAPAVGR